MKFYINGEEKGIAGNGQNTLGDFVVHVSKSYISPGEIITDVRVNGQNAAWKEDTRPLESCQTIEITTSDVKRLLVGGLIDSYRLGESFSNRLRAVADGLATSDHQKALNDFVECLGVVQWFYTVLSGTQNLLGIAYDDILPGEKFAEHLHTLEGVLNNTSKALQDEDFVLLSDMIRYELAPRLDDFQKFLPALIKEAEKKLTALS